LSNASTILIYLGFIAILVMLGLPEVTATARKIDREIGKGESREIRKTVNEIAHKVRQYLAITLVTSLLTGIASALWAYALGLELPLVWGTLNFLLNFNRPAGALCADAIQELELAAYHTGRLLLHPDRDQQFHLSHAAGAKISACSNTSCRGVSILELDLGFRGRANCHSTYCIHRDCLWTL
jgi:hypothetical protein